MAGGLLQLVAYGSQDIHLTGNPQITFFKVVYRRHTNFAVEAIEQTINGSVRSGNPKVSVTIVRNGDLLHKTYIALKNISGAKGNVGFDAIDYIEVEVGGQVIDKHYGQWMKIWCDLTHGIDKKTMLNQMLWNGHDCNCGGAQTNVNSIIPLQFWFCRNPGLALPLIALQYHEVKLNIKFCNLIPTPNEIIEAEVWCDYIFLDTDERRRFAQVSHEYLIEQVQFNNGVDANETGIQHKLRFNHPVKELIWTLPKGDNICCGNLSGHQEVCSALLQLNGHDRFRKRNGFYFNTVQRYEHHTGTRAAGLACVDSGNIYMYSFAMSPEEHQPTGTCNFSRIDNAVLTLEFTNSSTNRSLQVWGVNYNVLRIMSGMGGLAYSN